MINIVTALQCEAKPLIHRYQLKGQNSPAGFRIYENRRMRLIVSGPGKLASAAACTYLYARHGEEQDQAWLNLGVAGHTSLPLGRPRLMHKIIDGGSDQRWYPPLVFEPPCPGATCLTVEQPQQHYKDDLCYEMEASGFYASASRFSSSELVQVLKIISDNRDHPISEITEKQVVTMIEAQLPLIDRLIQTLSELATELRQIQSPPDLMASFLEGWHFTTCQHNQLRQLLLRWQALSPEQPPSAEPFHNLRKSGEVLRALEQQLARLPIRF
ncbi:MAG TPA: hypothetical protein ENK35_04080 [Candidatus Tenderia sp.]|nr:hypothetical protein [Candidatus Tenderia sp.]